MNTTLPIPTRRNGLFTTNRGELAHPSLWDGLSLVYFPHNDGGGAVLKGYGELATDADLNGGYSWVESEIGRMVRFDGADGSYGDTNNTEWVDKIDGNDFSWHMWGISEGTLSNNERWWGSEDSEGGKPDVFASVKEAGSDDKPSIQTLIKNEGGSSFLSKTTEDNVDVSTRPISFSCSIDWSDAAAGSPTAGAGVLSLNGAVEADTQQGSGIDSMSDCDNSMYIGARNRDDVALSEIDFSFSTIAWWTRLLSQGEQRLLGTDPFVLCRRVS